MERERGKALTHQILSQTIFTFKKKITFLANQKPLTRFFKQVSDLSAAQHISAIEMPASFPTTVCVCVRVCEREPFFVGRDGEHYFC
jgi:hypothetical protein